MRRREVLRIGAVGAGGFGAGCLSVPGRAGEADPLMNLQNLSLDPQPEPLQFSFEIVDPYLTGHDVPVIEISLENTGSETVNIGVSSCPGLPWHASSVEPDAVGIGPERPEPFENDRAGSCPSVDGIAHCLDVVTVSVNPGDTIEDTRAVYPIAGNFDGPCPPTGTYRTEHLNLPGGRWGFEFDLVR